MVGTLHRFFDERRFGFIKIDGGGEIFVHLKEFDRCGLSPEVGERLKFRVAKDNHGRDVAVELSEL